MKARFTTLMSILWLALSVLSFGQEGVDESSQASQKEDSVRRCGMNYSLYREYVKQENYKDAYPYWKICYDDCPTVSKNLYIDGIKLYKYNLEKESNPEVQQLLLDTIMIVYDKRVEFYPKDQGRVAGYKGIDLLRYQRDDIEVIAQANDYLEKCIQLMKGAASAPVMATYMTSTISLFQNQKITPEDVIKKYTLVSEALDKGIAKDPSDADLKKVKENVDQNFAASGAANCDVLIEVYGPQYESKKTDLDFLNKITGFLSSSGCTESELFRNSSESLYKLEPSAKAALNLARLFREDKQFEKSAQYYGQSIEMETDPVERAKSYIELGDITFRELGNLSLARDYARKAAQDDPTNGLAYMLAGNIISSAKSCGEDDFEKKALYWLAVDYFIKAKKTDPALTEVSDRLIADFSEFFPSVEDIFFHGFKVGDDYTIECWINERTKVRSR